MATASILPGSRSNHTDERDYHETMQNGYEDGQHINGYHLQAQVDGTEELEARGSAKRFDQTLLLPYKQGSRPDLSRSHSGSEPDSLIDLYGHPRSTGDTPQKQDGTHDRNGNPEESSWIHRDKLALIERQEMQAAGITPPLPRATSRSRHKKEKSVDQGDLESEDMLVQARINKKRKVKPAPREDEQEEEGLAFNEFDIRTPEEIAAEAEMARSASPLYRQPTARSSSSRIPLPRSSPMPLPLEHLERTTPLPRKRNTSGTWSGGDEDGLSYNRLRSRGNSFGSQVLLDDGDGHPHPGTPTAHSRPSSSNSPLKARSASGTRSSHARKTSNSTPSNPNLRGTVAAATSPRSPSNPLQPSKSRIGPETRPATAVNRPEGEAPWLKDMYKPDPRLPPEQQLLPTHAKRLQEEQRRLHEEPEHPTTGDAKQAATNDLPDQDFDTPASFPPLAVHTRTGLMPPLQSSSIQHAPPEPGKEWPLSRSKSNDQSASLTAEKAGNAGYSAIPRVRPSGGGGQADGSEVKSPTGPTGLRQPHQQGGITSLDPFEKERMSRVNGDAKTGKAGGGATATDEGKERDKSKSCGCCTVM